MAMQIELYCPGCACQFSAPPDLPADQVLERMIDEGPWFALGEGETFEDMIFTALARRGRICCPECRQPVAINEQSLGHLARELFPCH
jgi:hypothetical protein